MSDLISRQDVYHILEKTMIDRPLDSDRWVIRDIDKAIRSLPSADRPTGEWIEINNGEDTTCECSKCHYRDYIPNVKNEQNKYECMDRYWFERKFCPNCGAYMKGESK